MCMYVYSAHARASVYVCMYTCVVYMCAYTYIRMALSKDSPVYLKKAYMHECMYYMYVCVT